jgi:hypothetical protein
MNLKNIIGFSVAKNIEDATMPSSDANMKIPRAMVDAGLTMKLAKDLDDDFKKMKGGF